MAQSPPCRSLRTRIYPQLAALHAVVFTCYWRRERLTKPRRFSPLRAFCWPSSKETALAGQGGLLAGGPTKCPERRKTARLRQTLASPIAGENNCVQRGQLRINPCPQGTARRRLRHGEFF